MLIQAPASLSFGEGLRVSLNKPDNEKNIFNYITDHFLFNGSGANGARKSAGKPAHATSMYRDRTGE